MDYLFPRPDARGVESRKKYPPFSTAVIASQREWERETEPPQMIHQRTKSLQRNYSLLSVSLSFSRVVQPCVVLREINPRAIQTKSSLSEPPTHREDLGEGTRDDHARVCSYTTSTTRPRWLVRWCKRVTTGMQLFSRKKENKMIRKMKNNNTSLFSVRWEGRTVVLSGYNKKTHKLFLKYLFILSKS